MLNRLLTIIVTASPIPTHPSSEIIDETLESLKFIDPDKSAQIVLAHDHHHPMALPDVQEAYLSYLAKLEKRYSGDDKVEVVKLNEWGCLAKNIINAIETVKTPFVLVVQHDFKFLENIDVLDCIYVMNKNPKVRHIRFNREANFPYVFDHDPKTRLKHYAEKSFELEGNNRKLTLIKTLGWSDNNHLCRTDYYREIVSPLTQDKKTFPEHPCNLASTPLLHQLFGTFVYGEIGKEGVIKHLDGRGTSHNPAKTEQNDKKEITLLSRIIAMRKLNQLRIKIAFERILYRSIAYRLLFLEWKSANSK
jgi:hypothetical protein